MLLQVAGEKPKEIPVWRRSHPKHSSAGRAIWPQAGQRPHPQEGCRSEDHRLSSPPLLTPLGTNKNKLELDCYLDSGFNLSVQYQICVVVQKDDRKQLIRMIAVQYTWLRETIAEAHESVFICHSAASQTPVGESIYKDKQSEIKTERAQGRHSVSYDSLYQYPNCLNLSATMQPSPLSSLYLGNKIIVIK